MMIDMRFMMNEIPYISLDRFSPAFAHAVFRSKQLIVAKRKNFCVRLVRSNALNL